MKRLPEKLPLFGKGMDRMLLQPVSGTERQGMATIQVAETLELRQTLARQILLDTLWRQAGLVLVIAAVVVAVVHRVTRPVRALSAELASRPENDLRPLDAGLAPREIAPLIEGANLHMARLSQLLEHQKRFVRDSSHQLRTPLAVLKTQVQSALRGDVEPRLALEEIAQTVQGATELANQMLALAKVEQLRSQADIPLSDWAPIVHTVALDLSALVADKSLDFELETQAAAVRAHEWSLRELTRNLLHNDAPARLAQWLLQRLPQRSGQAELRLQERKRDIAQQLAMSPETLSRLMRSFEARGVLSVRGYQVQVRDVDELRALAGSVA